VGANKTRNSCHDSAAFGLTFLSQTHNWNSRQPVVQICVLLVSKVTEAHLANARKVEKHAKHKKAHLHEGVADE